MRKKPMKRLLAMVLAVVCVVGLTSTACAIDQPPVNSATSACVMDVDSGRILYSKNENAERCIASITKIMTAILVIENNTDFNQVITASKTAAAEDGTSLYLLEGDDQPVRHHAPQRQRCCCSHRRTHRRKREEICQDDEC